MSNTNLVSLQTLTDGKIQATRSQCVKSRNPERMSLDRYLFILILITLIDIIHGMHS